MDEPNPQSPSSDPTVQEFLDYLLYQRRCSLQTIRAYRVDLRMFTDFLQDSNLGAPLDANAKSIRLWLVNLLDSGDIPRSVNRKIATLRSYYRYFCSKGRLKVNPTKAIDSLKTPHSLPVFIHEDDMQTLLDPQNYAQDFEGQRDRTILQVLYLTGLRVSELCNLTIRNVDMATEQLLVLGKRNKQRIIPITNTLKSILFYYLHLRENEYGEAAPDDTLFLAKRGGHLSQSQIYAMVNKYIDTAALNAKIGPHVLRHSFATALLNNGADLMAIKELLGHSSLAATQVYAHSDFEQLNKIYKQAHPRADN